MRCVIQTHLGILVFCTWVSTCTASGSLNWYVSCETVGISYLYVEYLPPAACSKDCSVPGEQSRSRAAVRGQCSMPDACSCENMMYTTVHCNYIPVLWNWSPAAFTLSEPACIRLNQALSCLCRLCTQESCSRVTGLGPGMFPTGEAVFSLLTFCVVQHDLNTHPCEHTAGDEQSLDRLDGSYKISFLRNIYPCRTWQCNPDMHLPCCQDARQHHKLTFLHAGKHDPVSKTMPHK